MRLALTFLLSLSLALPAWAEPSNPGWSVIGTGGLMVNDMFGDLHDRWHTSSNVVSILYGAEDRAARGTAPGEVIELQPEDW